jgi:hypothetical protein
MLPLFSPAQLTSTDPKPAPLQAHASNMQITSVKTKEADPNPQQARYEVFRVRIASVQLTLNNPQSGMPKISRRSHSFEQKK